MQKQSTVNFFLYKRVIAYFKQTTHTNINLYFTFFSILVQMIQGGVEEIKKVALFKTCFSFFQYYTYANKNL